MAVKIIAEIGVNHNGCMDFAKEIIDAAVECGADTVKFQTFSAERLAAKTTPKVPYQLRTSDPKESHQDMLRKLEFPQKEHRGIIDYCKTKGVQFCSTPYSREDAEFLHSLNVEVFKTASADIVDRPMHEFIAETGKLCIVATGMATLGEIEETVAIYRNAGALDRLVLLQCVSSYPADPADVNLRGMQTLRSAFQCAVGLSDHTVDHFCAVAAVALGASVVEKHFTLDRELPGPDHAASITPPELRTLVEGVRTVEKALGDGVKKVFDSEKEMRAVSRKSIVAKSKLSAGQVLAVEHLTLRRPGTGVSPMRYPELIGAVLQRDLSEGEAISLSDIASADIASQD